MITIKTAVIIRFVARNHCFDEKKTEIADFFPKTIHSIEMGILRFLTDLLEEGERRMVETGPRGTDRDTRRGTKNDNC